MAQDQTAPVVFDVEYPESLSRLHLLLRTFLGWLYAMIPHGILLNLYSLALYLVSIFGILPFVAILINGKYPRWLFDLHLGYYRWGARYNAYIGAMTDRYPPFSNDEEPVYPVLVHIEYAEQLSKLHAVLKFFLGWLYAGIRHLLVLILFGILLLVAGIFVWFAILFTGRYPRGLFNLAVGYNRWGTRLNAYLNLMRDEYPPFSTRP